MFGWFAMLRCYTSKSCDEKYIKRQKTQLESMDQWTAAKSGGPVELFKRYLWRVENKQTTYAKQLSNYEQEESKRC